MVTTDYKTQPSDQWQLRTFLTLPYEIRLHVYDLLFPQSGVLTLAYHETEEYNKLWTFANSAHLLPVCRQIYSEVSNLTLSRTSTLQVFEIETMPSLATPFPPHFASHIRDIQIEFTTGRLRHFRAGTLRDLPNLETFTICDANPSQKYERWQFDAWADGRKDVGELWWWRPHLKIEDDDGKPETWKSYPNLKVLYTIVFTTDEKAILRGGGGVRYADDQLEATFNATTSDLVKKCTKLKPATMNKSLALRDNLMPF